MTSTGGLVRRGAGIHDSSRALSIHLHELLGPQHFGRAGQVKDDVDFVDSFPQAIRIADVAFDDLHLVDGQVSQPRRAGAEPHHLDAFGQQTTRQMRADEPANARHECPHCHQLPRARRPPADLSLSACRR